MALTKTDLDGYQDDAISMLHSLIKQTPVEEIQVKDAAVKVQAAALLLNLQLPPSEAEMIEHLRDFLRDNPEVAREMARELST